MTKLNERVQLTANILIIIIAILLIGVIVKKYYLKSPVTVNQPVARMRPVIGSKLNIPDENWGNQQKTLVLALQAGCRFCNESASFYKQIIESVKDRNVKLVAAFPTDVETSALYLKELGLANLEVKQVSLESIKVSGTPTLILTNDKGEVTNYWVGKLAPDKEQEVIAKLNS